MTHCYVYNPYPNPDFMDTIIVEAMIKLAYLGLAPADLSLHNTSKRQMLEMVTSGFDTLQDPVDGGVAVLVKRYNITQQKELELRLSERHGDLLRSASASLGGNQ